jgi:hypothetical protein
MKVAISSDSFASDLAAGRLTQLEWLEGSASRLGADGVVFTRAHFPRTDPEYVAQLRKVTIDLGLIPLGIDEPRLVDPDFPAAGREQTIALATGIGAAFVLTSLPPRGDVPPATFVAAVGAAKSAVRITKAANITLLVRIGAGTLAADAAELRHFCKDVDSAWLRMALPAGIDRSALSGRDKILLVTVDATDDPDGVAEIDEAARRWLLCTGPVDAGRVNARRRASAKKTLTEASALPS